MPSLKSNNDPALSAEKAKCKPLPFLPLDKTSFIPLPAQILAQLEGMIHAGTLQEGDSVPSDQELSEAYGVSRPAARQALDLLRDRGLLMRWKGRGTFVCRPKVEKNIAKATGFTDELEALGIKAGAQVLRAGRSVAKAEAATQLMIFRGTPVFCLRRLRLADGVPVAIEESTVELERFKGIEQIDFTGNSLYQVLHAQYGVRFTRASETIEAQAASRAEARLLKVSPRTSLLKIRRTVWGSDGRPVEVSASWFRGDRYCAVLDLPSLEAK